MKTKTYFNNSEIKNQFIEYISTATTNIRAAVAWFTDTEIFKVILGAANRGVKVELILMDDKINRASDVDFIALEQAGVLLFWFSEDNTGLMHHKFCVFDNHTVLSGSYNWTYRASRINRENVIVTNDVNNAKEFTKEFFFLREELKDFLSERVSIQFKKLIPYVKYNSVFNKVIGKWGFCDEDFIIVIPLEYDEARPFVENMAAVRIGQKWGFINKTGKMIIKCIYGEVKDFDNGLAFCLDGYYETEWLTHDCKEFDSNENDNEPYELEVTIGNWGCLNVDGRTAIDFKFSSERKLINFYEKHNVKNKSGKNFHSYSIEVVENRDIKDEYLKDDKNLTDEDLCEDGYRIDRENKERYYLSTTVVDLRDENNNIVFSHYEIINEIKEANPYGSGQWYGLSLKDLGEDIFLIELIAYYRLNTKHFEELPGDPQEYVENWVFANSNGNIVATRPPKPFSKFVNGLAKVIEFKDFPEEEDYFNDDENGFSYINHSSRLGHNNNDDLAGFINTLGEVIIPIEYSWKYVGDYKDNLIRVRAGGRYGYINAQNEQVIPSRFAEAEDFSEGVAAVKAHGDSLYCFVDVNGEKVIDEAYEKVIYSFQDGVAFVKKSGYQFYIDKEGNEYYE